jgi:hypothetical protein
LEFVEKNSTQRMHGVCLDARRPHDFGSTQYVKRREEEEKEGRRIREGREGKKEGGGRGQGE